MNFGLKKKLKHNCIPVYVCNKILDYRCRKVKAYIFVATTGRSGTVSLSKIFQGVDKAVCFHEPYPYMSYPSPSEIDKNAYFHDMFYTKKRFHIKKAAIGHDYYVETSHLFIKNFVSFAIECFGSKIKIIHLVRDPVSVATSFYKIDSIPGKTERGKKYLLNPHDSENIIQIADLLYESSEFDNDLYKCLWYWYEIEARIRMIRQKYKNTTFLKLRTEDLNNKDMLLQMLRELDMPFENSKLDRLVGVHANTKLSEKVRNLSIEECKIMNDKLLNRMEERYGKNFWIS